MPIRIYALAKKLNMDSKELVDACAKAGVTGKGSALASLTDDETAKVQAHLAKSTNSGAPSRPASSTVVVTSAPPVNRAISREDYVGPAMSSGRPKVLETKPLKSEPKPESEKPKPPVSKEPVVKLAPMPQQTVPAKPVKSDEPAPQKPIMTLPKDAIRGAK